MSANNKENRAATTRHCSAAKVGLQPRVTSFTQLGEESLLIVNFIGPQTSDGNTHKKYYFWFSKADTTEITRNGLVTLNDPVQSALGCELKMSQNWEFQLEIEHNFCGDPTWFHMIPVVDIYRKTLHTSRGEMQPPCLFDVIPAKFRIRKIPGSWRPSNTFEGDFELKWESTSNSYVLSDATLSQKNELLGASTTVIGPPEHRHHTTTSTFTRSDDELSHEKTLVIPRKFATPGALTHCLKISLRLVEYPGYVASLDLYPWQDEAHVRYASKTHYFAQIPSATISPPEHTHVAVYHR